MLNDQTYEKGYYCIGQVIIINDCYKYWPSTSENFSHFSLLNFFLLPNFFLHSKMSFSWWKPLLFTLFSSQLLLSPLVNAQCSTFCVRQEYRQLSTSQRTTYVTAVARLYQNARQTYNQFATDHNNLGNSGIHGNGMFLPWHRHFLIQYERALRSQRAGICIPYWDATLDNNSAFSSSPVFSTTTGFGRFSTGCVTFTQLSGSLSDNNGCVTRNSRWSAFQTTAQVNSFIVNSANYNSFSRALENGVHNQVHVAVGGNMGTFRSPIDPLFFLHHCNIDRIWAQWQSRNFNTRITTDYGWRAPLSPFGTRYESLTSFLPNYNVQVRDVMDISRLCYRYSDVPVKPGSTSTGTNTPGLVRRAYGDDDDEDDDDVPAPKSPKSANSGYNSGPAPTQGPAYATHEPYLEAIVDLGELCAVPVAEPLPESWLRANLLNVTEVRKFEHYNAQLVGRMNQLTGYLAPLAMVNDPESIKRHLEGVTGHLTKVYFSVHGKQHSVPYEKDCATTTAKVIEVVKKQGYLDAPKPSVKQLAEIIGEPAFPRNSPSNPFRVCRQDPGDAVLYGEAPKGEAPKGEAKKGGY